MTMKTLSLFSASLSIALTLGACSQESQLTQEDYDDVATGVGALVATPGGGGEAGTFKDALTLSTTGSIEAGTGSGGIEVVIRAGLSYEYSAECFSADGAALEVCDETTDSATVEVNWSGSLDTLSYDASITRAGEWSITGLQGDIVELTGNGSFEVESEFQSLSGNDVRSMRFSYDGNYDVQLDRATHRAVGGSIRYSIDGERFVRRGSNERDIEFSVDAEVSFAADGTATLTLDGSHSYTINVETGVVVSAS
jgi:hypothetical protein